MHNDRRNFMKKTLALGVGSMATVNLISCREGGKKAESKLKEDFIVGHGDFKYRLDKGWGVQDDLKIPVKDCHEMVQVRDGRLFLLTNHVKNNILVYDKSGKVLETWTLDLPGAHGLTYADEGGEEFLYLTDTDLNKVIKADLKGRKIMEFNYPTMISAYEKASEWKPTETAIAPNGDIYIADGYGKNIVTQLDSQGKYIRHFGGKGRAEDQFDCCHGVTLDTRTGTPELIITSRTENAYKRFTLEGEHIETIELPGCWICRPVIKGRYLYFAVLVTKSWGEYDGMVAILDEHHKVVSFPGGSKPTYEAEKLQAPTSDYLSFLNPHDVCVDNDLNVYVPQWSSGRTYPVRLERV